MSGLNNVVEGGGRLMLKVAGKACGFQGLKWSVFVLILLTLSGLNHKVLEVRHVKEELLGYRMKLQVWKRSFSSEKDGRSSFETVERQVPSSPDPLHNRQQFESNRMNFMYLFQPSSGESNSKERVLLAIPVAVAETVYSPSSAGS